MPTKKRYGEPEEEADVSAKLRKLTEFDRSRIKKELLRRTESFSGIPYPYGDWRWIPMDMRMIKRFAVLSKDYEGPKGNELGITDGHAVFNYFDRVPAGEYLVPFGFALEVIECVEAGYAGAVTYQETLYDPNLYKDLGIRSPPEYDDFTGLGLHRRGSGFFYDPEYEIILLTKDQVEAIDERVRERSKSGNGKSDATQPEPVYRERPSNDPSVGLVEVAFGKAHYKSTGKYLSGQGPQPEA